MAGAIKVSSNELFGTNDVTVTAMHTQDLESRILGTIYGNCIGDAVGLLTEFMVKTEAKKCYRDYVKKTGLQYSQKVSDMHRMRWKEGDWTDDSDQMIVIMDSLVHMEKVDALDFGQRLKHWSRHGFQELGDNVGMGIGTNTHKVLHHKTYATDPCQAAKDVWERTGCCVASNGAVMRTSALGLYQYNNLEAVVNNTLTVCKVTHADPRCQASCVAVTCAIAFMLQQKASHMNKDGSYNIKHIVSDSYTEACTVFPQDDKKTYQMSCKELKKYTVDIERLKSLDLDEKDKIGYTYKTLGAGFWALKQKDFRKAITDLTMEAGDADTNCAVAGALLGCKLCLSSLPTDWLENLRHKVWLDNRIIRFMRFAFPALHPTSVKELPFTPPEYGQKHYGGESVQSENTDQNSTQTTEKGENV